MPPRRLMLIAAALAAGGVPAAAQLANKSQEFVDAVRKDDGNKVQELLRDTPSGLVDSRGVDGDTALTIAVARRDVDWTGFLLNAGADPNLPGRDGNTPLILAARAGFSDAVTWLLNLGAKVDETNRMGETALIVAVQNRNSAAVRLLLKAGADPDRTDSAAGFSARDYARRDARSRDIQRLIEQARR